MVPKQVIVYSPKGNNNSVQLPFGTSLYDLRQREAPSADDVTEKDGVRLYTPEAALMKVSESFLARNRSRLRS